MLAIRKLKWQSISGVLAMEFPFFRYIFLLPECYTFILPKTIMPKTLQSKANNSSLISCQQ